MPSLTNLTTASPPHTISQAEIVGAARHVFAARGRDFDRLVPAYDNAGIETRRFCAPLEWYLEPHGWPERSALFVEHADALLEHTARSCLDDAGIAPEAVDALVVVSSTGIATPSLDARLMERMAFRRDIVRLPVFGLGCAGGALGLARADALARAMPGSRVLLLVVELCSLTFRRQDLCKSNIIASALFGDGAAAALIEHAPKAAASGPSPVNILATGEHTWPDSLDVMGWNIEEDGFGVAVLPRHSQSGGNPHAAGGRRLPGPRGIAGRRPGRGDRASRGHQGDRRHRIGAGPGSGRLRGRGRGPCAGSAICPP